MTKLFGVLLIVLLFLKTTHASTVSKIDSVDGDNKPKISAQNAKDATPTLHGFSVLQSVQRAFRGFVSFHPGEESYPVEELLRMNGAGPADSPILEGEELYGGAVLHTEAKLAAKGTSARKSKGCLKKAFKNIARIASFHPGEDMSTEEISRFKAQLAAKNKCT
jgi:hypothetical protein